MATQRGRRDSEAFRVPPVAPPGAVVLAELGLSCDAVPDCCTHAGSPLRAASLAVSSVCPFLSVAVETGVSHASPFTNT